MRTGWNKNETVLNATNVASTNFGLLSTISVDGLVMAQPLYVSQYQVPNGGGTHDLLIVATEHNSLYAIDAATGTTVWQRNFGASQSSTDINCRDIQPEYGINSTPVIVRTGAGSGTIYVVSGTEPSSLVFRTTLYAVDIGTGANQQTPVNVSASAVLTNGSTIAFDPSKQMQRTGLVWANNSLYVGIGSHCDNAAAVTSGWMLRYDANLRLINQFNTVDDSAPYELSGIWMGGYASSVDASGNMYFVTGNGAFDADSGGKNYGDTALKLSSTLAPLSYFTPSNWSTLLNADRDYGSGGAVLLPGSNALVTMGKEPTLYLLNATTLGGMHTGNTGAMQVYADAASTKGVWGGPALYQPSSGGTYVYYAIDHAGVQQFTFNGSALALTHTGSSSGGYGGADPVVTSNGTAAGSAVLWLVKRGTTVSLQAYDASDVTKLLFSGAAGSWTNTSGNAFVSPMVVAGRAYVGAASTVKIFGLINPALASPLAIARTSATARALPKTVNATILRGGRAGLVSSRGQHIEGFVVSRTATTLTLRRRTGATITVDITQAVRAEATGIMPIGEAVKLYGYLGSDGIFHVTDISHSSGRPSTWESDTGA